MKAYLPQTVYPPGAAYLPRTGCLPGGSMPSHSGVPFLSRHAILSRHTVPVHAGRSPSASPDMARLSVRPGTTGPSNPPRSPTAKPVGLQCHNHIFRSVSGSSHYRYSICLQLTYICQSLPVLLLLKDHHFILAGYPSFNRAPSA